LRGFSSRSAIIRNNSSEFKPNNLEGKYTTGENSPPGSYSKGEKKK